MLQLKLDSLSHLSILVCEENLIGGKQKLITFPFASTEPSEPYTFMPEPYLKYSADQMKFNGYATRYLSPRETASWRVSKFRGIFFPQ